MAFLQLPGSILIGAIQKAKAAFSKFPLSLLLEHLLQVLWEDGRSPD